MVKALSLCLFFLMLTLLSGCAGSVSPLEWQDKSFDLLWPSPPDKPRVSYLRSFYGPRDFKEKSQTSGMFVWLLGETQEDLPLLSPFSVASSQSKSLWVADSGVRTLYRFNLGKKKVEYFKEFAGIRLESPSGVAVDDERQRVYLADAALRRVFVLNSEGEYLDTWAPEGGFKRPTGLAIDTDGRLLVADAMGGVVYRFDVDGNVSSQIKSRVHPDGRFVRPLNVAVGPAGEILVLDALSFRVEVQSASGVLLGTIGKHGDAAGSLARPKGLAVDRDGHVFISDSAFDNIQVFDMAGNLLMFWGSAGGQPGDFNLPAGLFIDNEKRLFVADSYNHRVQAFQLLP